jgi:hypothetical protein
MWMSLTERIEDLPLPKLPHEIWPDCPRKIIKNLNNHLVRGTRIYWKYQQYNVLESGWAPK